LWLTRTKENAVKTLIAYYSFTGNNARLAQRLREQVDGELDPIVDVRGSASIARNACRALFRMTTDIRYSRDPRDYEQVILITPFWVGRLPPATRAYLQQHGAALDRLAILSICGRGEANKKALADVEAAAGHRPLASLLLREADAGDDESRRKIDGFWRGLVEQNGPQHAT
jgi:flavodoxin